MGVAQSIILYGGTVWEEDVRIAKYRKMVEVTQRETLLRVLSAYKTTSTKALQVIAREPPMEILIEESADYFNSSREEQGESKADIKARSIMKWQQKWENTRDVAQ
ncbi:hypothetical protein JTB14_036406 [Gonioctena quinquepunctata]|nr:hypothetical protein JTB14_036406 [Gonioctena quinquepunctata]